MIKAAASRSNLLCQLRAQAAAGLFALTVALISSGCSQQLTPHDVADRFWRAAVTGHAGKIKRYVLEKDRAALNDESKLLPISAFELSRIVIDGQAATIATSVTLDGDAPVTVNIDTRLRQEQGEWRVDYAATANEISRHSKLADVIGQISNIGNALKDGLDKSVEEITRAMPAIERELKRLESEFKQRLPELREELREFSKQLDESLKERRVEPKPAQPENQGTIAL